MAAPMPLDAPVTSARLPMRAVVYELKVVLLITREGVQNAKASAGSRVGRAMACAGGARV